ncbi:enoyl-CoA hydratase-related protein [Mesorhizobium silamurunense]|uniref:enoyl-CoA hydratase-related protein n=1 Tax=Mesorhizobium silamurunense TaxID=499528 RepID=UPI001FEED858|nr:enoyl-CoA hydratase-related protein [Mesorhizobium silamurunense]
MTESLVRTEEPSPGIRLLTLNRPEKLNALSKALLGELRDLLAVYDADASVGCVVLTGAGRAFAAGADISDMLERGVASYSDPERLACWRAIEGFSKPIIAAVNGYALGGGLELALMCDIILASESARFATAAGLLARDRGLFQADHRRRQRLCSGRRARTRADVRHHSRL